MPEIPSFAEVKARLAKGDPEAVTIIYAKFFAPLLAVVRAELGVEFQAKVDPEDLAQSALRSFFRREADGQFPELASLEELWRMLVTITKHKCSDRRDYYRAERRNVSREVSLETLPHGADGNWEAIAPEPTPEQVAIAADLREYLFRKCGQRCRAVLALSFDGYTVREISEKLNCDESTVRRILQRARDVAKRYLPEETQGDGEGK